MKIFSVLLLLALVFFCGFGFSAVVDLSDPSRTTSRAVKYNVLCNR